MAGTRLTVQATWTVDGSLDGMTAIVHRPEGNLKVPLVDDGSVAGDDAQDRVWTAVFDLPPGRYADLELQVVVDKFPQVAYRRVIVLADPKEVAVGFKVGRHEGVVKATRVGYLPSWGGNVAADNELAVAIGFGWSVLVLVWVGWLWAMRRREGA